MPFLRIICAKCFIKLHPETEYDGDSDEDQDLIMILIEQYSSSSDPKISLYSQEDVKYFENGPPKNIETEIEPNEQENHMEMLELHDQSQHSLILQTSTKNHDVKTGSKSYKCNFCGKEFANEQNQKRHEKSQTACKSKPTPLNMNVCDQENEEKQEVSNPFKCSLCFKGFANLQNKRRHENSLTACKSTCLSKTFNHDQSQEAQKLEKQFETLKAKHGLTANVNKIINEDKNLTNLKISVPRYFGCPDCSTKFIERSCLMDHYQIEHAKENKH